MHRKTARISQKLEKKKPVIHITILFSFFQVFRDERTLHGTENWFDIFFREHAKSNRSNFLGKRGTFYPSGNFYSNS